MTIFLRIPGLGLPKAGFMCQLCAGLVGCMDVHNIRMYGLNIKDLTLAKNPKGDKAKATNLTKIVNYIDLCTIMEQKTSGIAGVNTYLLSLFTGLMAIMYQKYTILT
jgi:hypothetical protein